MLPTIWFRNTWSAGKDQFKPRMQQDKGNQVRITHPLFKNYYLHLEDSAEQVLFTNNETNREKLYSSRSASKYVKDAFHQYLVNGEQSAVNAKSNGTKAAAIHHLVVEPGQQYKVRVRLSKDRLDNPFDDFSDIVNLRQHEADRFYQSTIQNNVADPDLPVHTTAGHGRDALE